MKSWKVWFLFGLVVVLSTTAVVVLAAEADDDYELKVEETDNTVVKEDDEVYNKLSENFNKLSESAKKTQLKMYLDNYFQTDVFGKIAEIFSPAFDAVHKATTDDFEGDLSTLKKLKAEINKVTAKDGETARFITNLYRMAVPKEESS